MNVVMTVWFLITSFDVLYDLQVKSQRKVIQTDEIISKKKISEMGKRNKTEDEYNQKLILGKDV